VTDPELPGELELRPGESRVLRLPGRGVSGYRWETAVEGSAVEVKREVSAPGGAPGAAGDEQLTVTALAPGEATVTVARRRRWGPPTATAESVQVLVVRVSADG
jgi:predicted secreted protein